MDDSFYVAAAYGVCALFTGVLVAATLYRARTVRRQLARAHAARAA